MDGFDSETLRNVATECPGYQARVTARALTRYYNSSFKPLGLTAEQFGLLVGIGTAEEVTLVDLADKAGIDPTTLSRNVRILERRDLVRAEGGRGRAGKRLALTTSGLQLMADALPIWHLAKTELAHRMGDERLCATREAMAELAKLAKSPRT